MGGASNQGIFKALIDAELKRQKEVAEQEAHNSRALVPEPSTPPRQYTPPTTGVDPSYRSPSLDSWENYIRGMGYGQSTSGKGSTGGGKGANQAPSPPPYQDTRVPGTQQFWEPYGQAVSQMQRRSFATPVAPQVPPQNTVAPPARTGWGDGSGRYTGETSDLKWWK